ncbi:dihydrofolate reductase family protein [Legionella gresilensis]|uniref:dihydrofolate reductase family protein n=1 Tax=Legionella gresilensis TaxID=91823 RepID=UPI001040F1F1|nr:dihydrofolate reductase family protein [Legionella gresilensis]
MPIKCSVFIAISVDGFIARQDGAIDWLMKANTQASSNEDGGYHSFIQTVDALVMGRKSFAKVLTFDEWPYGNLPVIVLSSKPIIIPNNLQHTVSNSSERPTALVKRLASRGFKHLYIDGGNTIQRFLTESLINELTITLTPVLIGSGRTLFGYLPKDVPLKHIETKNLSGGFVQLKYCI